MSVLYVDDDPKDQKQYSDAIKAHDGVLHLASGYDEAKVIINQNKDTLTGVVCDGLDGDWKRVMQIVTESNSTIKFVLLSTHPDHLSDAEALGVPTFSKLNFFEQKSELNQLLLPNEPGNDERLH